MGKHSSPNSDEDKTTPYGSGPHPTPEESQAKADSFDRQYEASKNEGDNKNQTGQWRG